jgi:hypothetical protein
MKKSLTQLMKAEIVTLEKSKMLSILGGAREGDSTTKEWRTLVDGHPIYS